MGTLTELLTSSLYLRWPELDYGRRVPEADKDDLHIRATSEAVEDVSVIRDHAWPSRGTD